MKRYTQEKIKSVLEIAPLTYGPKVGRIRDRLHI